jgi:hypothetical protein
VQRELALGQSLLAQEQTTGFRSFQRDHQQIQKKETCSALRSVKTEPVGTKTGNHLVQESYWKVEGSVATMKRQSRFYHRRHPRPDVSSCCFARHRRRILLQRHSVETGEHCCWLREQESTQR